MTWDVFNLEGSAILRGTKCSSMQCHLPTFIGMYAVQVYIVHFFAAGLARTLCTPYIMYTTIPAVYYKACSFIPNARMSTVH